MNYKLCNKNNIVSKYIYLILLQAEQEKVADAKLAEKCGDMSDVPKIRLVTKKTLKGHINKVNSVHYSGDSRLINVN